MTITIFTPPATEPLSIADVKQYCQLDEMNFELPPSAPTVALATTPIAGNVDNGAHRYLVVFLTSDGMTDAGTATAAVTVADKTVNGQVALTAIPLGGSMTTSRKLYRTLAGGSTYYLLATIANNTATTYTDNIADSSLGAQAPTINTTGDPLLNMMIKTARMQAEQELRRYLITQTLEYWDDDFDRPTLLPPLVSVTHIKYTDILGAEQTLSPTLYVVDNKARNSQTKIEEAYGIVWPSVRDQANSVSVRFVAGYGGASDVPACIKQWMLMRIRTMWDNRSEFVMSSTTRGAIIAMPNQFIDGMLDPERVTGRI